MTFESFDLPRSLIANILSLGYQTPTPIQEKVIPIAAGDKDFVASAETGSGKTAAYLLPVITKMTKDRQAACLVLVPTRELAEQVIENAKIFARDMTEINPIMLIGGVSMRPQIQQLSKSWNLMVATPGRLIDHLRTHKKMLSNVKYLVLDECDRMMDFGFAPQLNQVLRSIPIEKQTMMFSATLPSGVKNVIKKYLNDPIWIRTNQQQVVTPKINQQSMHLKHSEKNGKLLDVLNDKSKSSAIIFAKTKNKTDLLFRYLEKYGYNCDYIHGGRSQAARRQAIDRFRTGDTKILVATDVASRGLDISQIGLVINYDLPQVAEDYIHRIGRTGRAGHEGEAITFLTHEDKRMWMYIQKLVGIQATARV